jgi:amino-acid N-acetyltransferase
MLEKTEMQEVVFTFAKSSEEEAIRELLMDADLPAEDFARHLQHFLMARQDGTLVGVIGLEPYGKFGLLRSLVVPSAYRGQGLGQKLCERVFSYARELGIKELYLLTTTAEKFFPKLGFDPIARDNVPVSIQATEEFSSICPSTAVCMIKKLG